MRLNDKIKTRICYFGVNGYTKEEFIINNPNDLKVHESKIFHEFSVVMIIYGDHSYLCFSIKPDMSVCDSNGYLYLREYSINDLYDLMKNRYKFIKNRYEIKQK